MCFLFLDPQDEVCSSISSSVVLCSFVLLVYIVVLVLVVCLCPSSVHVVATFSGNVLFFFTMFCAPEFCLIHSFLYLVLLFQVSVLKISSVLHLNVVPLFFFQYPRFTSKFHCRFRNKIKPVSGFILFLNLCEYCLNSGSQSSTSLF